MVYRTYQTEIGAGDWDVNSVDNHLNPSKEKRFWYAMIAFAGWGICIIMYALAKTVLPIMYDFICPTLLLNIILYQYLYMPFNPLHIREYCFWAIVL